MMFRLIALCLTGLMCLTACASTEGTLGATGFEDYLPNPLEGWERTPPTTGPADIQVFGGGLSTRAVYQKGDETCTITMTGNAPKTQGFSMNFSNPAAAGLTGARVAYVGDEPIVITAAGEVQTLTKNYLTQYQGSCSYDSKIAYVETTNFGALQDFKLPPAANVAQGSRLEDGLVWEVSYGGVAKDWAYAMTGTADGGLCVAGRTASKGAGLEDLWVVRLDGAGNKLWERTFGGTEIDRGRGVIEMTDGSIIVAGATESKGSGEFDAWVMKLDADGNLIWDQHFGGPATDWASALVETQDGGIAVGAYTQIASNAPYNFWILKLDQGGSLLWERTYGGAKTDWVNALTEDRDGNLVAVGHTESLGAGSVDYWVVKLARDGEMIWDKTFGGPDVDYASAVTAARDGGLVVAGMTRSEGAGGFDIRVFKLDASGTTIWDQTIGGELDDWARAVLEVQDGKHVVAGYRAPDGEELYDFWTVTMDENGELLREQTFGDTYSQWARALVEFPDGGLALAGDTWTPGAGESDIWILKTSP